eukprot:COSAG02_NODE_7355_length_3049_cov_4.730169_3_plen_34_part_00
MNLLNKKMHGNTIRALAEETFPVKGTTISREAT